MSHAGFALQTGIWQRLDSELDTPVYSAFVPQDAAFPYVVIGEIDTRNADTDSAGGQISTVSIHAFDKNISTRKTIDDIMTAIDAALHNQNENITVEGYSVSYVFNEFSSAFLQDGGNDHYYHGVIRYRVRLLKL